MPKRGLRISEYQHQVTVFDWAGWNVSKYPELKWLNGSLNGVKLTKGQAAKMAKAGLISGIPDIDLPVRRAQFGGLRIELKAEGGRLSPDQADCLAFLSGQGYMAVVCVGNEAAIKTIASYLEQDNEQKQQ